MRADSYIGTTLEPPADQLAEVGEDADTCHICGRWTYHDDLDGEGSCENCVEEEAGE